MKRILIISNNPLGDANNNAKTLSSFFRNYDVSAMAQLYFYDAFPDKQCCSAFFRITDRDMLASIFWKSNFAGRRVVPGIQTERGLTSSKSYGYFARFMREVVWKTGNWKTEELVTFIAKFAPDEIFFVGGDCCFAYDICKFVCQLTSIRPIVFVTDDYILPRFEMSPFFWIRRRMLLRRMKESISNCSAFLTISDPMRECYRRLFGRDSIVAVNEVKEVNFTSNKKKGSGYKLVYVGGLHYKRYRTLLLIGKAIAQYNETVPENGKVFLSVYSQNPPNRKTLNAFHIADACEYRGALDSRDVPAALHNADVLVFAESFCLRSRQATKLSLSTKVPEYLSMRKCILAAGPKEIGSMLCLSDCAFCVFETKDISKYMISNLITEFEKGTLQEKAYEKFVSRFKVHSVIDTIINTTKPDSEWR